MVSSLNGAAVSTQNSLVNPVQQSQDTNQQREAAQARRESAEENRVQRNESAEANATQESSADRQQEEFLAQRAEAQASGDNGDEQRGTRLDISV